MAQTMSVLGIDIAKLVFHVVGMDDTGHVVLRKRLVRSELLPFIAQLPPLRIGMEACGSAHYWARRFREHGHDVWLIAPQFVKAYVKSPKNDARDAEAIWEAATRPTMRFVPIKQLEQPEGNIELGRLPPLPNGGSKDRAGLGIANSDRNLFDRWSERTTVAGAGRSESVWC